MNSLTGYLKHPDEDNYRKFIPVLYVLNGIAHREFSLELRNNFIYVFDLIQHKFKPALV